MSKHVVLLLFIIAPCSLVFGQNSFYVAQNRPNTGGWFVLNSPHFNVIYPAGFETNALRAAKILEHEYPKTSAYMGSTLSHFPVILTNYNDLSNGFVSSSNFRSEVDLAPFKGKSINPQSGSWLEAVLPHELVHASHANNIVPVSVPGVFSFFSPDIARSFNMFPPLGVHEGLAVHYESTRGVHQESGRNNYAYFTNQFAANRASDQPWTMSQAFTISDYSIPSNRHYVGASTFTEWLHQTYGERVAKMMIESHQRLFFLGYGYSMRQVTGKWPKQLYRQFEQDWQTIDSARISQLGVTTDEFQTLQPTPYKGVRHHRPIWISDSQILFFSQQYNAPSAFYMFDLQSLQTKKIAEAAPVADYSVEFDVESATLLYAEYFSLQKYSGAYQSDIVLLDLKRGQKDVLTNQLRVFSPQKVGNRTIALQTQGSVSQIVEVFEDNSVSILKTFEDNTPIALKMNPVNTTEVAILLNKRGVQAVWITKLNDLDTIFENLPDIVIPNASIHDIVWHKSGERVLFTADRKATMNVFEWTRATNQILQLTNTRFSAFEPTYMPDDAGITYVTQIEDEQRIAHLQTKNLANIPVEYSEWLYSSSFIDRSSKPFLGDDIVVDSTWITTPYSADYNWLKPRVALPFIEANSERTEWGATFFSIDPLQSQSYGAQISTLESMVWYDVLYSNKTFYPGFELNVFREPQIFPISIPESNFYKYVIQEEQGTELSLPFQWYGKNLTRTSLLRVSPSISVSRIRYHDLSPTAISDFSTQYSAGLSAQIYLGVQQLYRDVQPSRGLIFYTQMESTLNSPELEINFSDGNLSGMRGRRAGMLLGANAYFSPYQTRNHSLRLSVQTLQQNSSPIYSTSNILPLGFSDPEFESSPSLSKISTRYAIPLFYPDNGGFLVPFYVSSIYLTGFTHTMFNFQNSVNFTTNRTILGAGVHLQFKISNLSFQIGTGFAFDPTTNNLEFIIGSF